MNPRSSRKALLSLAHASLFSNDPVKSDDQTQTSHHRRIYHRFVLLCAMPVIFTTATIQNVDSSNNGRAILILAVLSIAFCTMQVQDLSGISNILKEHQQTSMNLIAAVQNEPDIEAAEVIETFAPLNGSAVTIVRIRASTSSVPDKKPTFFLHVGPPKTSSTTIQAYLTLWKQSLKEHDNTIYLGRHFDTAGNFFTDPNTTTVVRAITHLGCWFEGHVAWQNASENPECYQGMLRDVGVFYTQHTTSNVILSDEVLLAKRKLLDHLEVFEFLQETLFQNYTLKIITTYRRLEDWYPSARKQINLRSQKRNVWQGYVWPLFPNVLGLARSFTHRLLPTPWEVIERLREYNEQDDKQLQYHFYNLHDESTPMLEYWLCNILHATNSCAMAKQQQNTTAAIHLNSDQQRNIELLYDEVVSWAAHKGVLDKMKVKRKQAIRLAMEYDNEHNRTHTDLPLKCPSREQYEEYYNLSRQVEAMAVPGFEEKEAHSAQFWTSVDAHKYCSVDTAAVLQDGYWQEFFTSLVT